MVAKVIVVTGIGVVSSCGIGREAFSKSIFDGVSGIKQISLFDNSAHTAKTAGQILDFDAQQFLQEKGLRTLDRATKLAASAAKLALDDAKLEVTENNCRSIAVSLGCTLGSVNSVCQFDKEALKEGPRYVNPAKFPNTVINSPASQISIRFNIRGFNSTISTGSSAGLDALGYAADMLCNDRARIVLAGGAEEFCLETFLGFYKTGLLAGTRGQPELSCPFDRRRNGMVLGEGAALLVLEDLESALERKAKIYARILGYGTSFDTGSDKSPGFSGAALSRAMQAAMQSALTKPSKINYICAAANSTASLDLAETDAVKAVFGRPADCPAISSIKSTIGDCYSASGALAVAAAVEAIAKQAVPPTINYAQADPACDLNYVVNKAKSCKIDNILVNAFCPGAVSSSMVVSKFAGN